MTPALPQTYAETLAHLYPRTNGGIKLGLENTRSLLGALGLPEQSMRHVVVAGTNGKGSTSSLIAGALQRAGYRVGLYTSPHLLRFTERIQVNGHPIEETAVVKHYQAILDHEGACEYPPTFFEAVTAMTLLEFQAQRVEIAVLEVGLGGRLDSTNVVPKDLAVITPIALDHQQFLGDTLGAIATEKAGILPVDGEAVTAPQDPEALSVLQRIAAERGTRLRVAAGEPELPLESFPEFQRMNIRTAQSACLALKESGFRVQPDHFLAALSSWRWPGRFQVLPNTPEVLLDGAHNPHALKALLQTLSPLGEPLHVVFSATATKDARAMLGLLSERARSLHLCPSSVRRSLSELELKQVAGADHAVHPSPTEALAAARLDAQQTGGRVVVTGSLFLVADVLHAETGAPRDPAVAS